MKRLGNILVGAGAVVGAATVTAIATGVEIQLTPEMIQLLTYKAFGAAAVGLIIVGTWLGRAGTEQKNDTSIETTAKSEDVAAGPPPAALPDQRDVELGLRRGEAENVDR